MALRYLDTAIGLAVVLLLLSLLVTALVQSVIALFNLRGTNLKWGLETLLGEIDPQLTPKVRSEIAQKVLTHPAIASTSVLGRRRRAVAIRVKELFQVIQQLRQGQRGLSSEASDSLNRLSGESLIDAARLDQLATEIGQVAPEKAAVLRAWLTEALGKGGRIVAGVNDWFDSIMDRTTQRFAVHARLLSVSAAILLTLLLRLDAPGVLNRIWSSGALREQLVAAAPGALRVADTVRSYEARQQTLASRVIRSVREEQADTGLKEILARAPAELASLQEGVSWLGRELSGRRDSAAVLTAFRQSMASESDSLLRGFSQAARLARAQLADPAIGIFQAPLPHFGSYWGNPENIVRGLVSVVLLSLGAPFWYNALRRLADLRPPLARKLAQEEEPKERA
jgi:hypothetical protein